MKHYTDEEISFGQRKRIMISVYAIGVECLLLALLFKTASTKHTIILS
jgi:hypothetical protein